VLTAARRKVCHPLRCEQGQATIELVGGLPAIVIVGLVAWQLALVGHAAWLCANAARVAARAAAVGRDPGRAARSALPAHLERGLEVDRRSQGGVRVRLRVPLLVRRWGAPVRIGARASLGGPR
jgi:type IV secretory pathway TrbD component